MSLKIRKEGRQSLALRQKNAPMETHRGGKIAFFNYVK